MRTEKVAFNVPVDILASLKIGARGLESDMRRSLAVQYFRTSDCLWESRQSSRE